MAHHDRCGKVSRLGLRCRGVDRFVQQQCGERPRAAVEHRGRAGKALGLRILTAVINDSDVPPEEGGQFGYWLCIRARAQQKQPRGRQLFQCEQIDSGQRLRQELVMPLMRQCRRDRHSDSSVRGSRAAAVLSPKT